MDNNNVKECMQKAINRFTNSAAEEYIVARGISKELAYKYGLGCTDITPGNGAETVEALLIPTSDTSYITRKIDVEHDDSNRYTNSPGESHLFNESVLNSTTDPVFVVEGAIDALSVMECGYHAVSLNSTSGVGRLLSLLEKKPPSCNIIISLDHDDAGQKATAILAIGLEKLKIPFQKLPNWNGCKDANELLVKDNTALKKLLLEAVNQANRNTPLVNAKDQEFLEIFDINRMDNCIPDMLIAIEENANRPRIATGIQKLDQALEGGLLPGLHLVAAMSSLGKTTLVLQMVANMAKQGHDVIFFSLEMSRLDLFAKNISRHGFELDMNYRNTKALSTAAIVSGEIHTSNNAVKDHFQKAVGKYNEYADKLTVIESTCNIGAVQIKEIVENFIRLKKKVPIVVIDYAQLMHPVDVKMSDKQNMDYAIKSLKQLASQGVAVIAISALNRQSYDAPVTLSSLKETGSLEYSSETVLALDFEAMYDAIRAGNPKSFDLNAEKEKEARRVLLTVLKRRNGPMGMQIPLTFYPKYNLFVER